MKKKSNNNIYYIIFVILLLAFTVFVIIQIAKMSRERAEVKAILNSDDPTGNLIQLLAERPDLDYARAKLDELGDPLLISLSPVCDLGRTGKYQSIPGTKVYDSTQFGSHRMIILRPDGESHPLTYEIMALWGLDARDLGQIELIACVQKDAMKGLEKCNYEWGSSITRLQNYVEIEIFEAATGKFVAKKEFLGSLPANCPTSRSKTGNTTYEGGSVYLSEIDDWLATFYQ